MSQRRRKLDSLVASLQLQHGPRAAVRGHDLPRPSNLLTLSTTFPELDRALGGGLPRGRISELAGPATSGKVTLAAKVVAAAHAAHEDALCAWVDLAHTLDPDYMYRCGADLDRLLVVRPQSAADALAITLHLAESNTLSLLVFDGLADLAPDDASVLDGSVERLAAVLPQVQAAVLFLSEPDARFAVVSHMAAVSLEIHREQWLTRGRDVRGYVGQVALRKHKLGRPLTVVSIRILFNGTVRGDRL